MFRRNHLFFLLAEIYMWISIAQGETKKEIIFNTIECTIRSKILSKFECQLESRLALNILATVGNQKAIEKLEGIFDLTLINKGQKKPIKIKNVTVDICHLDKFFGKRSIMSMYYKGFRRAAVNFPDKCPFQKNTTYFMKRLHFNWQDTPQYLPECDINFSGRLYANDELGFEIKLTAGFFDIANNSLYKKPLP